MGSLRGGWHHNICIALNGVVALNDWEASGGSFDVILRYLFNGGGNCILYMWENTPRFHSIHYMHCKPFKYTSKLQLWVIDAERTHIKSRVYSVHISLLSWRSAWMQSDIPFCTASANICILCVTLNSVSTHLCLSWSVVYLSVMNGYMQPRLSHRGTKWNIFYLLGIYSVHHYKSDFIYHIPHQNKRQVNIN